ncbi:hypothetical protein DIPPA_06974 [Diplonema papillatum]|nr:hypothetical protein DIPPA_06974 [Diplonema papillatum]
MSSTCARSGEDGERKAEAGLVPRSGLPMVGLEGCRGDDGVRRTCGDGELGDWRACETRRTRRAGPAKARR